MKKLVTMITILVIASGIGFAKGGWVELKGGYFSPTDSDFKDIYGGGMMFSGEACFSVWKNLMIWAGGGLFSKTGYLTFTEEETKLTIVPVGGGIKYLLSQGTVSFYGGLGLQLYQYKESNPIGDVSKSGPGFVTKAGAVIKITKGLLADIYGQYSFCKMTPADFEVNIGGIEAGIGIGYGF